MVSFAVNDQLSFQLNANNLFDKEYYVRVRNNGWATPGDARSLVLTRHVRVLIDSPRKRGADDPEMRCCCPFRRC